MAINSSLIISAVCWARGWWWNSMETAILQFGKNNKLKWMKKRWNLRRTKKTFNWFFTSRDRTCFLQMFVSYPVCKWDDTTKYVGRTSKIGVWPTMKYRGVDPTGRTFRRGHGCFTACCETLLGRSWKISSVKGTDHCVLLLFTREIIHKWVQMNPQYTIYIYTHL